jgi:hypothetical protein
MREDTLYEEEGGRGEGSGVVGGGQDASDSECAHARTVECGLHGKLGEFLFFDFAQKRFNV